MECLFCTVNHSPGMRLSTTHTGILEDEQSWATVLGFPGGKPPLGGAKESGTLKETLLFPFS